MVFSHLRDRNPLKLSPFRLCHEFHHLSGYRMEKGKACGAQSQAACPDGHIRSGTIFPVTSQRHSCMSHLNPDLVMTACIQMNSKQPFFLSGNCIHSLTENLIGKSGLLRTRSVRIYHGRSIGFSIFFQIILQNFFFFPSLGLLSICYCQINFFPSFQL